MAQHARQTPEDIQAFFHDWIESANAGHWERFSQLMHPDIVLDDPMTPQPARGRHGALLRAQAEYEPFPDGRIGMVGAPLVSLGGPHLTGLVASAADSFGCCRVAHPPSVARGGGVLADQRWR